MIRSRAAWLLAVLVSACLLTAARSIHASTNNLLINGDFNAGSVGWTTWANGWANFEIPAKLNPISANYTPSLVGVYDGTLQLTVGGVGGGWAGAYQTVAAAEGVEYTLAVQSGIENWWKPIGEVRMIWLNATNGEISRNVLLTSCAINADCPPGTNDIYDVGIPYANWTNIATAPIGTRFVKVEFADPIGQGSVWFDNANLTAPIDPPVITDVSPNGMWAATNTLSFKVTSAVTINAAGIEVLLNGTDISGSLGLTGAGTTNVQVSYSGLQSNTVYTAVITVTDNANLTSFLNVNFDTYEPLFSWEAEDYDFDSGQFINDPIPSDVSGPDSYFGRTGAEGVDFHDHSHSGAHDYRSGDFMATQQAGEPARPEFTAAGASDYNVGWFDGISFGGNNVGIASYDPGEWVNYTRNFPPGTYNIYGRLANGNGGTATIPLSKVTGGWGTSSQTNTPLGVFRFPAVGWGSYAYVPLTDELGNKIAVPLSGTNTLRVTAGSGGNLNFFMLVPADADQPTFTALYPNGRTLLQGTNTLRFTASSASHSIPQSNVVVTLNGVDVSATLSFSGSSSSWNVSAPLALRVTNYEAVIDVTDDVGNSHALTVFFDTFDPASFIVEGEDFDFDGGQFIDNPVVTSNAAPDSYFDKESIHLVDTYEGTTLTPADADFRYRQLDPIATSVCTDRPLQKTLDAQATNALAFNYNAAWWSSSGWLNFTRTYPAGNFNVYGRLAGGTGISYSISLDEINGTTNHLGNFVGVGRGYNLFDWIPLVNTNNSQLAVVSLNGVATLRATTLNGEVNPNNFLFVPAVTLPEDLGWSYAGGVLTLSWSNPAFHLQSQTNAPGAGLSTGWLAYPGGANSPVIVPVGQIHGSVYFRLSN